MSRAAVDSKGGVATLIIGQRVRVGHDEEYRRWQQDVNAAAARFPGYRGSDLRPPTEIQQDWLAVYQFDSVSHVQNWLNSARRLDLLDEATAWFDGPGTAQVIAEGSREPDTLVTVVVTHRVAEDKTDDFLAWQRRVDEAESAFPGYRGSEVFRPVEGVQDSWTISYRFDTAGHLDAWLTSDQRRRLLDEAEDFSDYTLSTIDHSFGSWFSFGDKAEPPPSDFKTSIAVWVGLYPTVVFLTLLIAPVGMPLWLEMLIGNLVSSFVMSYFTMPRYVNPLLGWWLSPRRGARQPATDLRGLLVVLLVNAAWMLVFYLITVQFWSLP
ncbi:antibiotic biosynthesis monooxygenase [Mycobacterium sp. NPDC050551]|uniref:antibiotic biosynthesis monooxygenase n=1 Tax=Mycobacterium sp. NPDC050551 TaxID=3155407 RepID=UPI0034483705